MLLYALPPNVTGRVSVLNANDPTRADARNLYGLGYNFNAVIGTAATLGTPITDLTDKISPTGWSVPRRGQFELLIRYVSQTTGLPTTCHELSLYGEAANKNISLFGALGGAARNGETGGYNARMEYMVLDTYTYTGTAASTNAQHRMTILRLLSSSTTPIVNTPTWNVITTGNGNHIRCIRDQL